MNNKQTYRKSTNVGLLKKAPKYSHTNTSYYLGGLIMKGSKVEFISTAEGRALPKASLWTNPDSSIVNPAGDSSKYVYEYSLKDHLGNLRVACRCADPVRDTTTGVILANSPREPVKAVQTEDYDAWGLAFGSRSLSVAETNLSKYKYNGKEEVQDLGIGLYEYGFRWYDAQIAKFVQVDPLADDYSYKSTYDYAENSPLSNIDLDGLEKVNATLGIRLNSVIGKNGGSNLSMFAGASLRINYATPGVNIAATYFRGGVGTSSQSRNLFNATLSPSVTFGGGNGWAKSLNTFNSFSGTGVTNTYTNSISFGANHTFSTGKTSVVGYSRSQTTSFFGFTVFNTLSAGSYNDTQRLPFYGDGKDEFWSAGIRASFRNRGIDYTWTSDMYYGKSNHNNWYKKDKIITGKNYDDQPDFDMNLNNALETFSISNDQFSIGVGVTGRYAMWPSRRMHNTMHNGNLDNEGNVDKSKHFHHLFVPNKTSAVLRVGVGSQKSN